MPSTLSCILGLSCEVSKINTTHTDHGPTLSRGGSEGQVRGSTGQSASQSAVWHGSPCHTYEPCQMETGPGEGVASLDQPSLPEGLGKPSLVPGPQLAVLPKRTKAREDCTRLEGPHGAALWGTGMHKPVGEAHGDQTAESRNENRLVPKGGSFNPVNTRQVWRPS